MSESLNDSPTSTPGSPQAPGPNLAPPPAGAAAPFAPGESTFRSARAWATLVLVMAIGLVLDLWTKAWAFATIYAYPIEINRDYVLQGRQGEIIPRDAHRVVIDGWLEFKLVLNVGAVFGAGEGKRWLFIGVTIFAVAFGIFLFGYWTRAKDWLAHVAIGLLLAGGLGNLYDRIVFGCVRDFIHPFPAAQLPFGWHSRSGDTALWPYVSNVADKFLIIGIAILLIHAWRIGASEKKAATPA